MNMIDVFSGLGGMSESMIINGWDVKRIDNNILLNSIPNTTIQDVQEFYDECVIMVEAFGRPKLDFLHFSPPCLNYSNAYNAPKNEARMRGEEYLPDMSLLHLCLEIIELLKPRYWCIENVVGAAEFFEPIIGPYRQKIGAFCFWGTFPKVVMPKDWRPERKNSFDPGPSNPLRANFRAMIPFEISQAFRLAIENQKQLTYWF